MGRKGQAKMATTMVGVDWGMAALGITSTSRKARVDGVRTMGLPAHYGEHAAISTITVIDRRSDVAHLLAPIGADLSTTAATIIRDRRESLPSLDLLPELTCTVDRPDVIHSVHGVIESGNWFLLADVGDDPPFIDDPGVATRRSDVDDAADSWLVVVGRQVRDIILPDESRAEPTHAL